MAPSESPTYALRIIFECDGSNVRQISQQRFEQISPPSHVGSTQGEVGFWYELRDTAEKVLYRRVLYDPMQFDQEVPAGGGGFSRQPNTQKNQIFQIVAPDLGDAANLVLVGSPPPPSPSIGSFEAEAARSPNPRVATQPAREIARFALTEKKP